jgi:hypothetical protein
LLYNTGMSANLNDPYAGMTQGPQSVLTAQRQVPTYAMPIQRSLQLRRRKLNLKVAAFGFFLFASVITFLCLRPTPTVVYGGVIPQNIGTSVTLGYVSAVSYAVAIILICLAFSTKAPDHHGLNPSLARRVVSAIACACAILLSLAGLYIAGFNAQRQNIEVGGITSYRILPQANDSPCRIVVGHSPSSRTYTLYFKPRLTPFTAPYDHERDPMAGGAAIDENTEVLWEDGHARLIQRDKTAGDKDGSLFVNAHRRYDIAASPFCF